jgi:opacity protein-like surface antigen
MKNNFLFMRAGLFFGLSLLGQTGFTAIIPANPQATIYGGVSYANGYTRPSRVIPIDYIDNEVDTRSAENNGANFISGIGIAYDFLTASGQSDHLIHDFSVGLDLLYLKTALKGKVFLYGDPALNRYNYKENFNSMQLMIDGQLNFRPIKMVTPFVQVGYGVARIQASYDSSLSPLAPSYTPSPGYVIAGKTNYNPVYALGVGIQFALLSQLNFSIRYLYTDLGTIETGGGVISNGSLVNPIKSRVHTQAGLAGLTYVFH